MRDTHRNLSQKLEKAAGIISFQPFFPLLSFSKARFVPSADLQTRKFTHGRKRAAIKRLLPSAVFSLPFRARGGGDFGQPCVQSSAFSYAADAPCEAIFLPKRFSNQRRGRVPRFGLTAAKRQLANHKCQAAVPPLSSAHDFLFGAGSFVWKQNPGCNGGTRQRL